MKKQVFLAAAIGSIFILSSCKDKSDDSRPGTSEGNIAVSTMLPNPDGMTGASYLQLIDDSEEPGRKIDNRNAVPIPYGGSYPLAIGNEVFVFPSYAGDSKNELIKYTRENGTLSKSGVLRLLPNSSACGIVKVSDEKAYLSLAGLGLIWIFNPTTMQKTGEIDLTSLGYKDKNPDPAIMIVRDGILFVGLSQMVGGYVTAPEYKQSDMALIDISTDKLVKMISETTSGYSQPTRPIDPKSIFIDEKGDMYISCLGNFGMLEGHKAGILRIKKGETEFDPTYHWTITGASIQNEEKTAGFTASICYMKNGKAYGYVDMPGYYKPDDTGMTAISNRAVEFDLYNQTMTKIEGLELSTGFGILVSEYRDYLAISNASATVQGIYRLHPAQNKVDPTPMIITTGAPMSLHYFRK